MYSHHDDNVHTDRKVSYTPPLIKKPRDKKPVSERDAAIFFLSLRNEGLDLPEQICHEMPLIYEFGRHSTIFRTEISSRIHFWDLEGPKMVKIGRKLNRNSVFQ